MFALGQLHYNQALLSSSTAPTQLYSRVGVETHSCYAQSKEAFVASKHDGVRLEAEGLTTLFASKKDCPQDISKIVLKIVTAQNCSVSNFRPIYSHECILYSMCTAAIGSHPLSVGCQFSTIVTNDCRLLTSHQGCRGGLSKQHLLQSLGHLLWSSC